MNTIIWSPLAEDTYASILDYLTRNFDLDIGIAIHEKVTKLLEQLQNFKHLCPTSRQIPNTRRCVIHKYLSMSYEVSDNHIRLIAFYDNRISF